MGLLSVLGSDVQDPVATVVMDCQPVLRWTAGLSCDGLPVCLAIFLHLIFKITEWI